MNEYREKYGYNGIKRYNRSMFRKLQEMRAKAEAEVKNEC